MRRATRSAPVVPSFSPVGSGLDSGPSEIAPEDQPVAVTTAALLSLSTPSAAATVTGVPATA